MLDLQACALQPAPALDTTEEEGVDEASNARSQQLPSRTSVGKWPTFAVSNVSVPLTVMLKPIVEDAVRAPSVCAQARLSATRPMMTMERMPARTLAVIRNGWDSSTLRTDMRSGRSWRYEEGAINLRC